MAQSANTTLDRAEAKAKAVMTGGPDRPVPMPDRRVT